MKNLKKILLMEVVEKHIIILVVIVLAFGSLQAQMKPEILLNIETSGNEILSDDYEYGISPQLIFEWESINLLAETKWYLPLHPEANLGEAELNVERVLHSKLWWLDFKLGNTNLWIFEDSELEGVAFFNPIMYKSNIEFELGFETQYMPDLAVEFAPSIVYEFALPRGIAEIGVGQTIVLYDEFARGETEFPITYEFDAGENSTLGFEFTPLITEDNEFNLNIMLKAEISFD